MQARYGHEQNVCPSVHLPSVKRVNCDKTKETYEIVIPRPMRLVFTALHGMQTRSSDEISAVCLSVKRVHCDKTEEKSVRFFIPCESSFSLVF